MKKLITITGPSTAGKSTLLAALKARNKNLVEVVSHTTRVPRAGEVNGRDYHFVSPKKFDKIFFIEKVKFADHWYGTSIDSLKAVIAMPNAIPVIIAEPSGVMAFEDVLFNIPGIATEPFKIFINVSAQVAAVRLLMRASRPHSVENMAARMVSLFKHELPDWNTECTWDFRVREYTTENKQAVEDVVDAAIRMVVNPLVDVFMVALK